MHTYCPALRAQACPSWPFLSHVTAYVKYACISINTQTHTHCPALHAQACPSWLFLSHVTACATYVSIHTYMCTYIHTYIHTCVHVTRCHVLLHMLLCLGYSPSWQPISAPKYTCVYVTLCHVHYMLLPLGYSPSWQPIDAPKYTCVYVTRCHVHLHMLLPLGFFGLKYKHVLLTTCTHVCMCTDICLCWLLWFKIPAYGTNVRIHSRMCVCVYVHAFMYSLAL
jgi:hypothetical protein